MKNVIFTKEDIARKLLEIAEFTGSEIPDDEYNLVLWGNTKTGEISYSESNEEYCDFRNDKDWILLTEISDYIYNVYYEADNGLEAMIEENYLEDVKWEPR